MKRILVREITDDRLYWCYTEFEFYNTPSCLNIIDELGILDLIYSLLILNSKLIGWFHNKVSPKANKGLFPKIIVNDFRNIPIVLISKESQLTFVELADNMLEKNKDLQNAINAFTQFINGQIKIVKLNTK
jgi:hypothetical protein